MTRSWTHTCLQGFNCIRFLQHDENKPEEISILVSSVTIIPEGVKTEASLWLNKDKIQHPDRHQTWYTLKISWDIRIWVCICNKSQKHRVQTCWSLYEYMFLSHRRNHQLLYDIVNRQRLIIQTAVLTAFQEGKYSLHLFIKQIFNLRSLPILNKDGGSAATCRENRASEPQRSVCKNNVCVRTCLSPTGSFHVFSKKSLSI